MPQTDLTNNLPSAPGVYKMIDKEGRVIYVGKAKDIKKRVKQYFQNNYQHSTRTRKMVENIANIEAIATDSELEAILLETNIIKQLLPKYNILMKDDKNYVYIKITKNEDFPRIQIVRQIEKDGAKYIGPKTAAHKVKETFKMLKKLFPFRHCGLDIALLSPGKVKVTNKVIKYPCIDYHIKRCAAPCIANCSKEEYAQIIKNIEDFLEGRADNILKDLNDQMQKLALDRQFEKAARLRDRIVKVRDILEKQKISDPTQRNQDIINFCLSFNKAYFNLFQVRDGKLINQENFILDAADFEESESQEILEAFIKQYYEIATDIPKEILIPQSIDPELEKITMAKFLVPQIGQKNKLLEMSLKNAQIYADRHKPSWEDEKRALDELAKLLKLPKPPKRIECYDISHLSGTDTVGSMVVFENGSPKNSHYRKFKLRTTENNDYKSMEEVFYRRFSKLGKDEGDFKLKKATKKDMTFIEAHNKATNDKRTYYIFTKDKENLGFIAINEHSDKVSEISNLWLKKEFRGNKLGHKIINEVVKRSKAKRIYGICKPELYEYYALFGFEEINKVPKEMEKRLAQTKKERGEMITIVYDKIKQKKDESFSKKPDLIVIDGGKGQLSSGDKILQDLNLKIPRISLAKRLEEIFTTDAPGSILLPRNSEALKLLQRARDEAHRFAITYNKDLRTKRLQPRK